MIANQLAQEDISRQYRIALDDLRLAKAQIGNVELLKEQIISLEAKAVYHYTIIIVNIAAILDTCMLCNRHVNDVDGCMASRNRSVDHI